MKTVSFPAKSEQETGGPKPVILCVEDDPDNLEVLIYRIGKKYSLLYAQNDQEACSLLLSKGKEIGMVLMDIELKNSTLNGIELTRLLRGTIDKAKLPEYAREIQALNVPVLLITAYNSKYKDEISSCGALGVINKPVDFAELVQLIAKHVQ